MFLTPWGPPGPKKKKMFSFSLFPFHARPGLTRPGVQDEPQTEPRRPQDAFKKSPDALEITEGTRRWSKTRSRSFEDDTRGFQEVPRGLQDAILERFGRFFGANMEPGWYQIRILKRSSVKIACKLENTIFPIEFHDFLSFGFRRGNQTKID